MLYTDNLNLKKPEQTEFYNVDDFNENADILDEKFGNISNDVDSIKENYVVKTDVIPIANGGTGATTASDACANIGAVPLSGATMTGDLLSPNRTFLAKYLRAGDFNMLTGPSNHLYFTSQKSNDAGISSGAWLDADNFTQHSVHSEILTSLKVKNYIKEYGSYNAIWYIVLNDGMIIQGGKATGNATYGIKTITFLKPFTAAVYDVIATYDYGASDDIFTNTSAVDKQVVTELAGAVANVGLTNFHMQARGTHFWLAIGW